MGHTLRSAPATSTCWISVRILMGSALAINAFAAHPRSFVNPYGDVQWDEVSYFRGNLHTHTTYSDGEFAPHEVIDLYRQHGYHILALTDHDIDHADARPAILFPWTEVESIFEEIKDSTNTSWRYGHQRFGEFTGPWENRDPQALSMLAIPGVEVSRPHHIASLFCDYAGNTASENTAFEEIGRSGGLAVLLHPGRYEFEDAWYLDFYRRHAHLVGLEVYNQNDRYPGDRELWDRLLHELLPDRPVWGFAGDDMHSMDHLGWNIMLFPLHRLTTEALRTAIETGAFLFYRPRAQGSLPSLQVTRVLATPQGIGLELEGQVEAIDWITYDADVGQSTVVHQGPAIAMDDVPDTALFVRARIRGTSGTAYTQPFAISSLAVQQTDEAGALSESDSHLRGLILQNERLAEEVEMTRQALEQVPEEYVAAMRAELQRVERLYEMLGQRLQEVEREQAISRHLSPADDRLESGEVPCAPQQSRSESQARAQRSPSLR